MKKQINKVLLFSPPVLASKDRMDINPYPPLGLGYIAATLKQMDIEVKIVDCYLEGKNTKIEWSKNDYRIGLDLPDIEYHIRKFQPDMMGISQMFSRQTPIVEGVLRFTKQHYPEIITVIGGAHPSALPQYTRQNKNIDYIIEGEGENNVRDLIDMIQDPLTTNCRGILNVPVVDDLDTIPFPDWEAMNLPKYFGSKASHGYRKKKRFCPVITSRGCPIGCSFCTAHCVWGKKYRKRSIINIRWELAKLKMEYDIQEIMFEDDNLTLDKVRAKKLFWYMREFPFVWDTPNGISPWTLDEEMLDLMKASGCYRVNMAIESASYEMIHRIGKPVNLEETRKLIDYCRKINLDVGIFLVIGLPEEEEKDRQLSYDFCKDNGVYFPHISIATPYPGSDLYKELYGEQQEISNGFLESLHIRHGNKEVKESLEKAENELLWEAIKNQPLLVIGKFIRSLVVNPFKTMKRVWGMI